MAAASVFGESAELLGDPLPEQPQGESGKAWRIDYLGTRTPPEYANGHNWLFRATHPGSGEAKVFRSGTEMGYFATAHTYESMVLIGADLGSGTWGFTIYDLEADRKIAEFWAGFPHISPDSRYLVYRKFYRRHEPMDPGVLVLDLRQRFAGVNVAHPSEGIGKSVFPPDLREGMPELASAYGTTVSGYRFEHVAWDMENKILYFTGSDRAGYLNLVAVLLEPSPHAVCFVPLTGQKLRGEYFDEQWVYPTKITLRSAARLAVTTVNGFGVSSEHNVALREACWAQDQEFAEHVAQASDNFD